MIDWPTVYRAAGLAALAILFLLACYGIVATGRLAQFVDLVLRLLESLLERLPQRGDKSNLKF